MTSRMGFLGRLSGLLVLGGLVGCSAKSEIPADQDALGCAFDLDDDGFGLGCPDGPDCNDRDPSIHQDCPPCSTPAEGCACAADSAPVECIDHALLDEHTVLCSAGTRYCRDGEWSGCESISQFERSVTREKAVGGNVQGLVVQDASIPDGGPIPCDPCSPNCFPIIDPLDPRQGSLPPGSGLVYADGGGITVHSKLVGDPIVVSPTSGCVAGKDPKDTDCDGIPDNYELAKDTGSKPFGTTASSIFMTLGPGQSGTANVDLQFYLRMVDLYFLFDMTAGTTSKNGTSDPADDFNVVQRLIASLVANPSSANTPFFTGSVTCADTDRDGLPNNTSGQGILGDLKCLLRDVGVGVGWTREVPFEGPVDGIRYGEDDIAGAPVSFSEFLFEQTSFIDPTPTELAANLGKLTLKENFGGPNGQIQGLWLTATGTEQYVGHDRPALPDQNRCGTGAFGYPCFRANAVPIVVMFTGAGMYNGPGVDVDGNAISTLKDDGDNSYPLSYPPGLHADKVHRGSYEGYLEVANTNDTFDFPTRTDSFVHPATKAAIGDMGDDLVTFTGDTTELNADVNANLLSCEGSASAQGADAIFYFSLAQDEPNFYVSTEGTRFNSALGIIKASGGKLPTTTNFDVTTFTTSGDDSAGAYDLQELPSGIDAIISGNLTATGNYPAESLECYSAANTGQCDQTNKASDYAPDVVFKFSLEQDMQLYFESVEGAYPSSIALFDRQPTGVTDLSVLDAVGGDPKEQVSLPTVLNGHAYRLIGDPLADCNAFDITGLNSDYPNSDMLYTSAPDTDPSTALGNSHCNANSFTEDASDMEVLFEIDQDDTTVVFETSGDQPKLDVDGDVILALRRVNSPTSNHYDALGNNETWSTPQVISETGFTSTSTLLNFVDVDGDIATYSADITGDAMSRAISPSGVVSQCTFPSAGIASLPDAVWSFTTTSTRSLKLAALGSTDAKHYLSVFRASSLNALPPTYGVTTTDESGVTNLGDVSNATDGTTTTTVTPAGSGDTYTSAFDLGDVAAGNTVQASKNSANANLDTSGATQDYDSHLLLDYVSCNGNSGGRDQVFSFRTTASGAATVSLTPNPASAWASALVVYKRGLLGGFDGLAGVQGACDGANNNDSRSTSFTAVANEEYYAIVSGRGEAGSYSIGVSLGSAKYDTIAQAGSLTTTATSGVSITNTTAAGTRSVTQNYDLGPDYVSCNTASGYDQVYRVTVANTTEPVTVALTGTAFRSALQVRQDAGGSFGAAVGCQSGNNTDDRTLTFTPSNTTFYVIVSGYDASARGAYTLTVDPQTVDPHVHDTTSEAHDLGTIDDRSVSVTQSTAKAGVAANYDAPVDYTTCNSGTSNADQVYKFHVDSATNNQIQVNLSFPTGTAAWNAAVSVHEGGLTTDNTKSWCSGGNNTDTRSLTLTPKSNTDYYVVVSGYSGSSGKYKLTVEDSQTGAVGCAASTAPTQAIVSLSNLPADTYYVVLKMDTAAALSSTFTLTIEDASAGPSAGVASTYVCELNNYVGFEDSYVNGSLPKRTSLEQTLDKGKYSLIMRPTKKSGANGTLKLLMRDKAAMPDVLGCHNNRSGGDGEAKEYFDYAGSPLSACEPGFLASNGCKDAAGVAHYKDYYLVMRAFRESDVPQSAPNPYKIYVRDLEAGGPVDFCGAAGNGVGTFSGNLAAGDYFAVVKGIAASDEGWYQITMGDKTLTQLDTNFSDLKSYHGTGGVLEALNAKGVRVIGVQDGQVLSTKQQLDRLANDTNAKSIKGDPLVIQLSDTSPNNKTVFSLADVGYGVTRAIQELAQSLIMDVTLVLDASAPNPGFTFQPIAKGSEPLCTEGISSDATTWQDCGLGAAPRFDVIFGNPANAPVGYADEDRDGIPGGPTDPGDPGGYNLLLNLVGKVEIGKDALGQPIYRSYVVEQVPVRIIPSNLGYTGPVRTYDEQGSYEQTFRVEHCLETEAPDWSRLSWSASIPSDSTIEWQVCTANTAEALVGCSYKTAAIVYSKQESCQGDADCRNGGYCSEEHTCHYIIGPACTEHEECGEAGTCVSGACSWPDLPVDVFAALGTSGINYGYAAVRAVLGASSDLKSAPSVYDWRLEYDCVAGE